MSRNVIVGTVIAIPTSPIAVGASLSSYTCHATATRNAPSPSSETHMPTHSSRKSRCRSGVRSPLRSTPPERSSDSWLCSIAGRCFAGEEAQRGVGVHRPCEQEPLAERAAHLAQRVQLLGHLDALRDDLERERRA